MEEHTHREASLKKEASKIQSELRSQVQNLEHCLDERSKEHSQIVSTLQRDQMLLENKLEYTEKNLLESNTRVKEADMALKSAKVDFEKGLK